MSERRGTLDLDEVQAALDKAAWAGLYGTAEERSGRFVRRVARNGEDNTCSAQKGERGADRGKKGEPEFDLSG